MPTNVSTTPTSTDGRIRIPPHVTLGFVVGVLAVVVSGASALRALNLQAQHADAANADSQLVNELELVLSVVKDAETGQRGFLLTGDQSYAEPFTQAREVAQTRLAGLTHLVADNPFQRARLVELRLLTNGKLDELTTTVNLKQAGDDAGAMAVVRTDKGKVLMDQIRNLVSSMQQEQASIAAASTAAWEAARENTRLAVLLGSGLLLLLFGAAAIITVRELIQRDREVWLRLGEASIAQAMTGDKHLADVANNIVTVLAEFLGARVGTLYSGTLASGFGLQGGYAFSVKEHARRFLRAGENLTGQAILSGKSAVFDKLPANYLSVDSSTGSTAATSLLIVPTTVDGHINGVIELGFTRKLSGGEQALVDRVANQIGVGLRTAEYRQRLENLLEETQRQAEELQTQQEELRVSNEELEEQSRILRDTQSRLQEQQAALEQNNEQLTSQASVLAVQRNDLERVADEVQTKNAELERSSQYKSNFLANMSHELRTPLNSSLILAKLLGENKEGNLNAEQVKFAETIYEAGNDLLDLINDVLDLSKIEAGHVEIRSQAVAISTLSSSLSRTFEPVGRQRKLGFNITVEPDVPSSIETDPQRLEQVLRNLLSNAFKFTDKGGVSLRIFTVDQGRIGLEVKDTGVGIPADKHDLVFEAFRQVDSGSARKHGGTGLGLSISRDLAQLLGGVIELQSAPNQGSTFTLTLPTLYQPIEAAPVAVRSSPTTPTRTQPASVIPAKLTSARTPMPTPVSLPRTRTPHVRSPTGSRTILIVEDDPAFATVVADTARAYAFEPIMAESADVAFEMALHHLPQAVVLDVRLPDHSGLSVLDRLKRNARTRHIPVHMISGIDHTRAALSMGAVGYALKPVHINELRLVLSRLSDRVASRVKRVLVIEDDAVQREAVRLLLGNDGVEVTTAATAAEAREQLKNLTFDCVVMDLNLPDESGHQLLECMAAAADISFPPVIVYTGKALTQQDEERLRHYSNSIIVKGARSPERLLDEVTLFLHQVESELPPERQRMLRQSRDREDLFEGRTLLIVEDDVRNIFALSRVLEPRGAHLNIARNGIEALERLEKGPPVDLVLMDVMMPEMDGLEATRRIRQNPKWANLPIISLTAKAMRDDQEKCLAAGANDYVAKPIDVDKLLSLIRVWMPK